MNRKQLQKIVNDYQLEQVELEHLLYKLQLQKRSINSRLKLIKRKILILDNKLKETNEEIINWSCNDFDDLDILL